MLRSTYSHEFSNFISSGPVTSTVSSSSNRASGMPRAFAMFCRHIQSQLGVMNTIAGRTAGVRGIEDEVAHVAYPRRPRRSERGERAAPGGVVQRELWFMPIWASKPSALKRSNELQSVTTTRATTG